MCGASTFTFMHLADVFIQSDLQAIQAIHYFLSMSVLWELNLEPSALLTQCFTTEPQEHNPKMCPKINNFDHNTANETVTEHCYKIEGLFKYFSTEFPKHFLFILQSLSPFLQLKVSQCRKTSTFI